MTDDNPLYHYTNGAALLSILTTGELWLSDPRFLNDAQEWKWAAQKIAVTIRDVAANYRQRFLDKNCDSGFLEFRNNFIEHFSKSPVFGRPTHYDRGYPFIFSFSSDFNSLGHWRAYGGEYCITFSREKIETTLGSKVERITYKDPDEDPEISDDIRSKVSVQFEHALRNVHDGRIDPEVVHETAPIFQAQLSASYFLTLKSPGFSSENELRVIVEDLRGQGVKFRSGTYPTPYLPIKIFDLPGNKGAEPVQKQLPEANQIILGIMCGPGIDLERARASVQLINARYHLGLPMPVESGIPFRQK